MESYFEYVSKLDPELYDDDIIEILSDNTHLEKFIKEIGKENIKNQLLSLGSGNKISKNEILKDIEPSLRLEWLISLFSYSETKDNIKKIKPNYHVNSDGQAIRHANGMSMKHSGADAVVYENNSFFTLEPTLLTGTAQYLKESPSTHRHLKK